MTTTAVLPEFISIQIIQHEYRDGERAGASPGSCYKVTAGWYKRNIYKYPARLTDWCRIHSTYKLLRKVHGVHVGVIKGYTIA